MTLLEILKKTEAFFKGRGIESSRLDSELLLSHLLQCKRLDLYLNYDKPLHRDEIDAFRELVRRRGNREPLQYVMGSAAFMDFELSVRSGVLIPRPETAVLVEALAADFPDLTGRRVLDLGCGPGTIALAVKRARPGAIVTGCDLSGEALAVALHNSEKLGLEAEWIRSDRFSGLAGRTFDVICSNPPYIPSAAIATLEPEVRDHEPRMALDGGPDGLDFYRALFGEVSRFLETGGRIYLEHGDGQGPAIRAMGQAANFKALKVLKDLAGKERGIVLGKKEGP